MSYREQRARRHWQGHCVCVCTCVCVCIVYTDHRSVDIPECPLLTVQDFPLNLVSFLVDSRKKEQKAERKRDRVRQRWNTHCSSMDFIETWSHHREVDNTTCLTRQSEYSPHQPQSHKCASCVTVCSTTHFACASACININSHFLAKALCSLAKLSWKAEQRERKRLRKGKRDGRSQFFIELIKSITHG